MFTNLKFTDMQKIILTLIFILFLWNFADSQVFEEVTEVEIQGVAIGSVAWGDYNYDGLQDFVITGREYEGTTPYYYSILYKNTENNDFKEIKDIFVAVEESSLDWGDYNNDNYIDMLLSGDVFGSNTHSCYSEIYKNNRNNEFIRVDYLTITKIGTGEMKWGNYNNNSYNDVLQSGLSNYGIPTSKLYKSDGSVFWYAFSFNGRYYSDIDWGDYDNDGYLDFIITGRDELSTNTKILKNYGDTLFEEQTQFDISNVMNGSVEWGDFDNDGFLDILITGETLDNGIITEIYKNINGNDFVKIAGNNFTDMFLGEAIWGDYNNDGKIDILTTGWGKINTSYIRICNLYKNLGNNVFTLVDGTNLLPMSKSAAAFGDYDNDNDLDLLLSGYYATNSITSKLYRNNTSTPNIRPNVITNLQTEIVGDDVIFSWDEGTDENQPSAGLNYNIYVYEASNREHIISGDTVYDYMYVKSPEAFPYHHPLNGKRLFPKRSHIQGVRKDGRVSYMLKDFVNGCKKYYWSVQAVDASFAGGPFAPEQSFGLDTIMPLIECVEDVEINLNPGQTVYTVIGDEFDPPFWGDNCPYAYILNSYNNSETLQGEEIPPGNYTITWTITDYSDNQAECSFNLTINEYVDIANVLQNNITVFPNPNNGKFTITGDDLTINGIDIYDLAGRKIFTKKYSGNQLSNSQTIDLKSVASGIYFMRIFYNQNNAQNKGQTTKLIIQ